MWGILVLIWTSSHSFGPKIDVEWYGFVTYLAFLYILFQSCAHVDTLSKSVEWYTFQTRTEHNDGTWQNILQFSAPYCSLCMFLKSYVLITHMISYYIILLFLHCYMPPHAGRNSAMPWMISSQSSDIKLSTLESTSWQRAAWHDLALKILKHGIGWYELKIVESKRRSRIRSLQIWCLAAFSLAKEKSDGPTYWAIAYILKAGTYFMTLDSRPLSKSSSSP